MNLSNHNILLVNYVSGNKNGEYFEKVKYFDAIKVIQPLHMYVCLETKNELSKTTFAKI
jgi:hypothetical protein